MGRWSVLPLCLFVAAGCGRLAKDDIISQSLPLSLKDIEEIRAGDENHRVLFEQTLQYKLFTSPELHAYVSNIGMRLARGSERPNLPYQFFIVDSDEVDLFGLGGGRIYITRGFFYFIESESELAAAMAHEIGHIASYRYAPEGSSKVRKGYELLTKGAEQGSGLAGSYGSAANTGIKALGYIGPKIKKRFSGDEERQADERAVHYLAHAGFNPRGLHVLADRLAQVDIREVGSFVDYMKGHPPFEDRRSYLEKMTRKMKFEPRPRPAVRKDQLTILPDSVEVIGTIPSDLKGVSDDISETASPEGELPALVARPS